VDEISESKELAELLFPHQSFVRWHQVRDDTHVPLQFSWGLVGGVAYAASSEDLEIFLSDVRSEEAHGSVGLGSVQHVVANGNKGDFWRVQVEVEDFQRLVSLLGAGGFSDG